VQFGAYRVIEPVAKDARADVYLAVPDAGFASSVVLRVIPASSFENDAARAEFTRSVKLYATLSHSAVVQTYDLFSENGNLVVVMEYVEGTALDDFLETLRALDMPMTDAAALFVGLRVVGALAAAHAVRDPTDLSLSPIVHGDVRPETILIPWDGYVRLADFRAAKTTTTFRARPGGVSRHAAPEVMREGRASTSSDVYSAALVVWELLTHRQAFPPSLGGAELMRALASPSIPRLATVRPDLPRKLVETLDRALEPRAEERAVTAAQLLAVLRSSFVPEEGETWIIRTLAHIQAGPTIRRAPESAPLVSDADVEDALSADATQKRKTSSTSLRAMPDESQPIGLLAWSDDATTAALAVPSTARLPNKMQKTAPMKNAPPLPPRAAPKSGTTPAPPLAAGSAPLGAKARSTMAIAGGPPASPRPPSKPPPVPAAPAPPAPPPPPPHEGREITLALAAPLVAEALAPSTQKSARTGEAPAPNGAAPPPPPLASPLPSGPPYATDPAPPPIMSMPPEIIHVPSPAVPQVEVWQPSAGPFPSQQPPAYAPLPTVSIPRSVPPPAPKKSSNAVWLVPLGILIFGGLGVTAYAFRDRIIPPKVATTPPKATLTATASAPIAVRTGAPVASTSAAPGGTGVTGASIDASAPVASASAAPTATAAASATVPVVASAAPSASASSKPVAAAPTATTTAAPPSSDLVADATHCVMHTRDAQPGHRIYYDNRVIGETPASVVVRCGVHEIKLGSAGYLRKPDLPCGGELSLK
jgi:eukaryotic-like serine/threonine-protein kinase